MHHSRPRIAAATRRVTPAAAWTLWLGLALAAIALPGCERGADSGATANPVAPGRPGTGNPVQEAAPVPGSINESPGTGGSRGLVAEGITGSGAPTDTPSQSMGSNVPPRQRGAGLDGGLDDSAPRPPGTGAPPPTGSPNMTSGNAVGQR